MNNETSCFVALRLMDIKKYWKNIFDCKKICLYVLILGTDYICVVINSLPEKWHLQLVCPVD